MFLQPQQPELMWLIFKMTLIRNFNQDKLERQEFALSEKNFTPSALMSSLDKSQLTVPREDSS